MSRWPEPAVPANALPAVESPATPGPERRCPELGQRGHFRRVERHGLDHTGGARKLVPGTRAPGPTVRPRLPGSSPGGALATGPGTRAIHRRDANCRRGRRLDREHGCLNGLSGWRSMGGPGWRPGQGRAVPGEPEVARAGGGRSGSARWRCRWGWAEVATFHGPPLEPTVDRGVRAGAAGDALVARPVGQRIRPDVRTPRGEGCGDGGSLTDARDRTHRAWAAAR
jgi:hypothetical protein